MSTPPQQPPVYPPPNNLGDQPTAPLNPVPGRYPPEAYPADPYVADARAAAWRLEGLRTALTIVGLLALIAIGLAVWALLRENNRHVVYRGPANSAGLVALNSRMNHLQSELRSLSTARGSGSSTQTAALAARVAGVEQAQKRLAGQIGHAGNTAQVTQLAGKEAALSAKVSQLVGKEAALSGQVSGLQGRVSSLAGQVSQLKSSSSNSSSNQTGTTGTTGTSTVP